MDQTYKDIECIIVDDATPDDSITKCEQMIAVYDGPIRFSILHHHQNRGLSAARNTGTEVATGEYLYYLDSDDELTLDCIETLLKPMMEDCTIEIVQGNHIDEENGKVFVYHKLPSPIVISNNENVYIEFYKNQNLYSLAWNKIIKRSFINNYGLYFKEGILHEDELWMFYVRKYLKRAYICNEITYKYHRRANSITFNSNRDAIRSSYLTINQEILNNLTPGREWIELRGNFYGFAVIYCKYVKELPTIKDVYRLYRKQALQHSCWLVYFLLSFLGVARRLGNPMGLLNLLHTIRWRLMELPEVIFNRRK